MMKNRVPVGLLVAGAVVTGLAISAACQSQKLKKPKRDIKIGQSAHEFEMKITKTLKGKYLLFLPEMYGEDAQRLPMILFLHGSGERGNNLGRVKKFGPHKTAEEQKGFPFIVLSPQCPSGGWWTDVDVIEMVMGMLDEVCRNYLVDTNRIYLTGLSMGGFGTWGLAQQYPNRFAAIAPVSGGGNVYLGHRLKNVPARVFHGAKDKRVPLRRSREMAAALRGAGGNVELIVYPNLGHDIWDLTYSNPKLYEWFLQHRRGDKPNKQPLGRTTQPADR